MADLFRLVLSTFHGEEVRQDEKTGHIWNQIIRKVSEMEELCQQQNGVAQNLSTNPLLMDHPVNEAKVLICGTWCSELDDWIG